MRSMRWPAAVCLAAVAVAGCGSSGSGSGSGAKSGSGSGSKAASLSPAAYRAKVDALCTANNKAIHAISATEASSVTGIEKLDQIAMNTLAKVKAVPAPASMSSGVQKWLGTIDRESGDMTQIIQDLKAKDVPKAQAALKQMLPLKSQDNANARALGLTACAGG